MDRPPWRSVLTSAIRERAWAEYRYRRCARTRAPAIARRPLRILTFFSRLLIESLTGISIDASARLGPGLYIGHFGGIIVGGGVVSGRWCSLSQGVTIGAGEGGSPTLGDEVYLAPGAKVFGGIVIGDRTRIGANAVVNRDTPADATAVGVSARIAKIRS